jgi:hypothetical protein
MDGINIISNNRSGVFEENGNRIVRITAYSTYTKLKLNGPVHESDWTTVKYALSYNKIEARLMNDWRNNGKTVQLQYNRFKGSDDEYVGLYKFVPNVDIYNGPTKNISFMLKLVSACVDVEACGGNLWWKLEVDKKKNNVETGETSQPPKKKQKAAAADAKSTRGKPEEETGGTRSRLC